MSFFFTFASSRPRVKATLHFHSGNAGIYLLPCRMVRIIVGSLQSPVYLRLRLRLLLMPAHARRVSQYLVSVPVIHMDGGAHSLGLEPCLIRLPEQEAQAPLIRPPYRFHVTLPHQRRPVRCDLLDKNRRYIFTFNKALPAD